MQRLYSTFARGWPGVGLVLLRFGASGPVIHLAMKTLLGGASGGPVRVVLELVAGLAGILLMIGLWTPIAGGVVAVTQLSIFLSPPFSDQAQPFEQLLVPVVATALAMLGPGAWSIDARLFGRKRLIHEP